jgi:adenosine deaminase
MKSDQELMTEYKELLKKHNLTDAEVGKLFGYSTASSWYHSSRRMKVITGVLELEKVLKLH